MMTLEDLQAHFVTHAVEDRILAPIELKKDIEEAQQKLDTGEYQFTHYNTEPITDQISVILYKIDTDQSLSSDDYKNVAIFFLSLKESSVSE